ncbi:MAG TPA: chemotaxis protein CheW [Xanthobacteraceae bacterium]
MGTKIDIATFFVGERLFAARADEIVEAIAVAGVVPLPFMPPGMTGCVMYRGAPMPVFDLLRIFEPDDGGAGVERTPAQVIVMRASAGARFGLLVDGLGEITEVLEDRLTFLPSLVVSQDMFADAAIAPKGADDGDLIAVLRADRLHENLSAPLGVLAASAA